MNRLALVLAAGTLGVLPFAGPASAGGGCHAEVTSGTTDEVRADHACFNPTVIRVAPGSTVTWWNDSEAAHNIHGLEAGGLIKDYQLPTGSRVKVAFPVTGVYAYLCTLHPNMKGVVTVAESFDGFDAAAVVPDVPTDPSPVSLNTPADDSLELSGGGLVGAGAGLAVVASAGGFLVGRRRPELTA